MIQVWILVKSENPMAAIDSGNDALICGDCPLRGHGCYVQVGQAPLGIWKAWTRGNYPKLPSLEVFRGHKVRFGAYGDPVFIPFVLFSAIARVSDGWTGYTHQWRNPLFAEYRGFVMASVESLNDAKLAQSAGWRTFRVVPENDVRLAANEIVCPNTTRGITCAECRLCGGTSRQGKSIVIEAHGKGRSHFTAVQRKRHAARPAMR